MAAMAWSSSAADHVTGTDQQTPEAGTPADNEAHGGIVVCLKWVATRPEIDPLTGAVTEDVRFSGVSPADLAALEWGLRIGEAKGLAVTAVTVGSADAATGLREAMAVGAARAIHLTTDDVEPSSSAVAHALAAVCVGSDLVLCGDHSLDRGSGSVPAFLANQLGVGQALGCVGLELDGDGIVAERRLDQGRRERLQLTGPTVLSFEGGLELRRAGLAATLDAADKHIDEQPFAGFAPGGDPAVGAQPQVTARGPYRRRPRALPAPEGSTLERVKQLTGVGEEQPAAQQLELSPADAADVVVTQLQSWGYLGDGDGPDSQTD